MSGGSLVSRENTREHSNNPLFSPKRAPRDPDVVKIKVDKKKNFQKNFFSENNLEHNGVFSECYLGPYFDKTDESQMH